MKVEVYVVNAFTFDGSGGNPAGIVYDWESQLSDIDMQRIAQKMGLSEVAFVRLGGQSADYDLRFFTPTDEVPLCGHATIASFWLMSVQDKLAKPTLSQKTKAGILSISIDSSNDTLNVWMTQSTPKSIQSGLSFDSQFQLAFPNAAIDKGLPIEIWSTGLHDILLPIKSRDDLNHLQTNMEELTVLSENFDVVGVHAFVSSSDSQKIYARNFAPRYGIEEESATGTSNGALTAYLAHHYAQHKSHLEPFSHAFEVLQGETLGNPSLIRTRLDYAPLTGESTIWVGGTCALIGIKEMHI